jgi:hypothetical protein
MPKIIPVVLLAFAAAAAGCSGSSVNCSNTPTSSQPAGNFTLGLALQHTADECVLNKSADGGPPPDDASIVPGTQSVGALLCASAPASGTDAGPTLYMVVANTGVIRQSTLDSDGGFTFDAGTTSADTLCNCAANIGETINGTLVGAGDGGFTVIADAGLTPPPTAMTGSVVQSVTPNPADGGCLCNMPCAEHYALTGTLNR